MKRTLGAAGSLLIHVGLLALLLSTTGHAVKPPAKAQSVPVHTDNGMSHLRGDDPGEGLACGGYHFNGIGLMFSPGAGEIIEVAPGSPASRAGLVVGDIMIDPGQLAPDRFPPGHRLVLRVRRAGREIAVPIIIGRICDES